MKRRDLIRMTEEEERAFLAEGHTLQIATIGRDGFPHLVAMWYTVKDGVIVPRYSHGEPIYYYIPVIMAASGPKALEVAVVVTADLGDEPLVRLDLAGEAADRDLLIAPDAWVNSFPDCVGNDSVGGSFRRRR